MARPSLFTCVLGLLLLGKDNKHYAIVCDHVTRYLTPGDWLKRKAAKGRLIGVGKAVLPRPVDVDESLDFIDIIEIHPFCQTRCVSGYRNTNGDRCKTAQYNKPMESLLGETVYHVTVDAGTRRIFHHGIVTDVKSAGEGHFFVKGLNGNPFASEGHSGNLVALERKDEVSLIGVITGGCFHRADGETKEGYVRCILLSKGLEILEQRYRLNLATLPFDPRHKSGIETGTILYWEAPSKNPVKRTNAMSPHKVSQQSKPKLLHVLVLLIAISTILYFNSSS